MDEKSFDTEFGPQWNDRWSGYQVRQNLALFQSLFALTSNWNCVKSLMVTKNFPRNWVWRGLGRVWGGKLFPEAMMEGIFETGSGFRVRWHIAGGVNFWLSAAFCWCRGLLGLGGWALGFNSMGFWDFPDLS